MNTTEQIEKMKDLVASMEIENSQKSKAAHGRARKINRELKKLAGEFAKTSVAEDKA